MYALRWNVPRPLVPLSLAATLLVSACVDQPLEPRTGPQARPAGTRATTEVSVASYGATCGDGTDDTPAIVAAMAASEQVRIPSCAGGYNIGNFFVPSGTHLYGEGAQSRLIVSNPSLINVVDVGNESTAVSDVVVESLSIERPTPPPTLELHQLAITVQNGTRVQVRNVRVLNIGGISVDKSTNVQVTDNVVNGGNAATSIAGVRASGYNNPNEPTVPGGLVIPTHNVYIARNQITNVAHGIQWYGGNADPTLGSYSPTFAIDSVTIEDNRVIHTGAGIWGANGEHIVVRRNYVEWCADVCLDAEGGADVLFEQDSARYAGTAVLSIYFMATNVRFVGNYVEQHGYDPGYGPLTSWESDWPVGRAMFAERRDSGHTLDVEPGYQTFGLWNNIINYTGPANSSDPGKGLGEIRKLASHWAGFQGNQMTNTVMDMAGNNNGALDISSNTLTFTRYTGGRPAIYAGSTHKGPNYPLSEQGELVVIGNVIQSTAPQGFYGESTAIKLVQWAWYPYLLLSTVRDNNLAGARFDYNIEQRNEHAAHHWYINNNGGGIRLTGDAAPDNLTTPN